MDKLRSVLSGREQSPDDETSIIGQFDQASTLSFATRVKAFAFCFVIGILMTVLGSVALFLHLGLRTFALLYTLGNILSMMSTCFLMGPFKQLKKMFDTTRLTATCIVIVSLIMTLVSACVLKKAGLSLLFIIIQTIAMTWYSLSYIPYARSAVKKAFGAVMEV